MANINIEDYIIILTYREHKFNSNVYDIKTLFYESSFTNIVIFL